MAIGQRIRYFRNKKGLTQKELGQMLGFLGNTSDVRMAQYESESRIPKEDLINEMAHIFDIRPEAINVPDIDSYIGLMHTLFTLEDLYGISIAEIDGEMCLRIDSDVTAPGSSLYEMLSAWKKQSERFKTHKISKSKYDDWRYNYPNQDTSTRRAKVPSPAVSKAVSKKKK